MRFFDSLKKPSGEVPPSTFNALRRTDFSWNVRAHSQMGGKKRKNLKKKLSCCYSHWSIPDFEPRMIQEAYDVMLFVEVIRTLSQRFQFFLEVPR